MADVFLATVFLLTSLFGYWAMDQVDRFLDQYVKGEGDANGQENTESN